MTTYVSERPDAAGFTKPRSPAAWLGLALGILVPLGPSVVLHLFTLFCWFWLLMGGWAWLGPSPLAWTVRVLLFLGALFPLFYLPMVRPWTRRWGASAAELTKPLPGDELVPDPAFQITRAVTIDAPIAVAWPWLAQIGQQQGGFYSYAWLENLAGCEIKNADRIHPEWQARKSGDIVHLHPALGLKMGTFAPPHVLVLDGWGAFVMEEADAQHTRLLARARVGRGAAKWVYELLVEIPHFIMERKMLLGIKQRAEGMAQSPTRSA